MKTIKIISITAFLLGLVASGAMAGDKYYTPSWNMPTGDITKFPKGHEATTGYTPNQIVNYDKQHAPWFSSTLKSQNLKTEE